MPTSFRAGAKDFGHMRWRAVGNFAAADQLKRSSSQLASVLDYTTACRQYRPGPAGGATAKRHYRDSASGGMQRANFETPRVGFFHLELVNDNGVEQEKGAHGRPVQSKPY